MNRTEGPVPVRCKTPRCRGAMFSTEPPSRMERALLPDAQHYECDRCHRRVAYIPSLDTRRNP